MCKLHSRNTEVKDRSTEDQLDVDGTFDICPGSKSDNHNYDEEERPYKRNTLSLCVFTWGKNAGLTEFFSSVQ